MSLERGNYSALNGIFNSRSNHKTQTDKPIVWSEYRLKVKPPGVYLFSVTLMCTQFTFLYRAHFYFHKIRDKYGHFFLVLIMQI